MREFYRIVVLRYLERQRVPGGLIAEIAKKLHAMLRAAFPAAPDPLASIRLMLLVPFAAIAWARVGPFIAAITIFVLSEFLVVWWMQTHYLAPAAAFVVLLMTALLRALYRFQPWLAIIVIGAFLVTAISCWIATFDRVPLGFEIERRAIVEALRKGGGVHLIMVPEGVHEFVFNGSDLQKAPVLWARSLDSASNARLLASHPNRVVWQLSHDRHHVTMIRRALR